MVSGDNSMDISKLFNIVVPIKKKSEQKQG